MTTSPPAGPRRPLLSISAAVLTTGVALALAMSTQTAAHAAQPGVGLGTATPYAVLAGQTVTNTGPSVISGDLGVSPGTAVTGFPPGLVQAGTIHAADAVALQAKNDLTTAYNDAAGRNPVVDKTNDDLGGETLVAGVYRASTGMSLTGTVTLDAQGDPNAVFIFQAGSTLTTASSSRVALLNNANPCNVFWQVGSSATIGTTTDFVGTVMALTSISAQTGATFQGRLLARNGSVTLDTNTINRPNCAVAPATPTATPTATTPPTTAPTTAPTTKSNPPKQGGTKKDGGTKKGGDKKGGDKKGGDTKKDSPNGPDSSEGTTNPTGSSPNGPTSTTGRAPTVPEGHPPTGRTPMATDSANGIWLGSGLAVLGGVAGLVVLRGRPRRLHRG
ncbi:ice-binding family protein [Nocardioides sp. LHG3406-4]|uniref:ice-binding family protein n=1 Tax=Nocardioides sp. LHG3406-4 TaxID=2804575 RepID=UPI003CE92D56